LIVTKKLGVLEFIVTLENNFQQNHEYQTYW